MAAAQATPATAKKKSCTSGPECAIASTAYQMAEPPMRPAEVISNERKGNPAFQSLQCLGQGVHLIIVASVWEGHHLFNQVGNPRGD